MQNRLSELCTGADFRADVVLESSLAGRVAELVARANLPAPILLVADRATYAALGERVARELSPGSFERFLFAESPHADDRTAARLRQRRPGSYLAVGSGTISDLCKYASHLDGVPYAVFPTAPSMNGYLSANASITLGGHKQTLPAHLPAGIFCDLQILAAAPPRLIRSGLGDSLCRPTAQADWLLSHLLLDTPYLEQPFNWLKPYESELFANAHRLTAGDTGIADLLMRTLLVSGLGMTVAGGSYPASEGEHLIAHTLEMERPNLTRGLYHGEQIGVTTLTMAALQEDFLSRPLRLPPKPDYAQAVASYFHPSHRESVLAAASEKYRLYEQRDAIDAKLRQDGEAIRDALTRVTLSAARLRCTLAAARAPFTPRDLRWPDTAFHDAMRHARYIRNRFTFLDLLPIE